MSFHHNCFNFYEDGPSQQQKHRDLIISFYCHTLCQRHSWPLRSPLCLQRSNSLYHHLISSQPDSFHSLKMNLRYPYPSALYYSFFRVFSEDCAHSQSTCLSHWEWIVSLQQFFMSISCALLPSLPLASRPTSAAVLPHESPLMLVDWCNINNTVQGHVNTYHKCTQMHPFLVHTSCFLTVRSLWFDLLCIV